MRRAALVRYAAASKAQSAATTVGRAGAPGPVSNGSAWIATSSAIGSRPESRVT